MSRQEYITDPYRDLSSAELEARGNEFDKLVDKDGNGEIDREEMEEIFILVVNIAGSDDVRPGALHCPAVRRPPPGQHGD